MRRIAAVLDTSNVKNLSAFRAQLRNQCWARFICTFFHANILSITLNKIIYEPYCFTTDPLPIHSQTYCNIIHIHYVSVKKKYFIEISIFN